MKKSKEKLVERLLSGNDNLFTDFVIVGLEDDLDLIRDEILRLLDVRHLSDPQREDLNDLYFDGGAIIRVLRYYTSYSYTDQQKIVNAAKDKLMGDIF